MSEFNWPLFAKFKLCLGEMAAESLERGETPEQWLGMLKAIYGDVAGAIDTAQAEIDDRKKA